MTKERAIEILGIEIMCVSSDCDRDCSKCVLAMEDSKEIVEAYKLAIKSLLEK